MSIKANRIPAVLRFESQLGRRLDIVHSYHPWADVFPSKLDDYFAERGSLLLLSWGGADAREIEAGKYDALIRKQAMALKSFGKPVLLEWRWEMNRPNLQNEIHSPDDYVSAWDHIQKIFADVAVSNVAWVWCPLANDFRERNAPRYYPGDKHVDWLCADVYAHQPTTSFASVAAPFMSWAARHDKPIVIGEYGIQGGRPGERARWIGQMASYVRTHHQIKAMVYFESQAGASGSSEVASEPSALAAMRRVARSLYFNPLRVPLRD